MWKNKSVFNNFHGVFNIPGDKKRKMNAHLRLFAGKPRGKAGGSVESKPLVGKTC